MAEHVTNERNPGGDPNGGTHTVAGTRPGDVRRVHIPADVGMHLMRSDVPADYDGGRCDVVAEALEVVHVPCRKPQSEDTCEPWEVPGPPFRTQQEVANPHS